MAKIAVVLTALCVLVSACSHTHKVPLQPNYEEGIYPDNEMAKVETPTEFSRGISEDKRGQKDKLTRFKQGIHTYDLYEERPLGDAIFEGLGVLLTKSGHQWNDSLDAEVQIDLDILSISAARNAGFVNVGATSSIQIKLDFIDVGSGALIYSQVYNGDDERTQTLVGTMAMVNSSIDACLVDCLNAVGNDVALAHAITSFKLDQMKTQ